MAQKHRIKIVFDLGYCSHVHFQTKDPGTKIGVSAFCTCRVYCLSDFDEVFFYEFFMKIPFRKRQYFVVSQTYVRSPLGQRKSDLLKTVDSVKEVKFI